MKVKLQDGVEIDLGERTMDGGDLLIHTTYILVLEPEGDVAPGVVISVGVKALQLSHAIDEILNNAE